MQQVEIISFSQSSLYSIIYAEACILFSCNLTQLMDTGYRMHSAKDQRRTLHFNIQKPASSPSLFEIVFLAIEFIWQAYRLILLAKYSRKARSFFNATYITFRVIGDFRLKIADSMIRIHIYTDTHR